MKRAAQALFLAPFLLLALGWIATWPPAIPRYESVRAAWQPSESWLYDRNGRLLDSVRVDFSRRRLAWVPLDRIPRPLVDRVIALDDGHGHGGGHAARGGRGAG